MSAGTDARLQGWAVGDRLWTPLDGTGTVQKLRPRAAGAPKALVRYAWRPTQWDWVVLANVERLRAGEPDRPSEGLQQVELGQQVWHTTFGTGTVRHVEAREPSRQVATIDFGSPNGRRSIRIGGGYLRSQPPPVFDAFFVGCEGIGITLRLTAGLRSVDLELSRAFDPFPDLMEWLEALVAGVEWCGFSIDEEGRSKSLHARRHLMYEGAHPIDAVDFSVSSGDWRPDAEVLLEAWIERQALVKTLYEALRSFAKSDRYSARDWEPFTYAHRVPDVFGCSVAEWVERSLPLRERDLAIASWPLRPLLTANARTEVMTADEYLRASGEHWDGTGLAPVLFDWCRGWDEMPDLAARQQRMHDFLQRNCLGGGGTPLRELRSDAVERWLAVGDGVR